MLSSPLNDVVSLDYPGPGSDTDAQSSSSSSVTAQPVFQQRQTASPNTPKLVYQLPISCFITW
ncbi:hypothetical protein CASFOL_023653 [Castilleja foliolosa]|uniref:Uncharacterized protein n=1 Tax=Castilleja foliolosa TaxID=1961234 RepID=A0ABD3CN56_9LAMI